MALLYIPWFQFREPILGFFQPFGILVATGVILGAQLAQWKAKKDGLNPETVMNLAGWVLVPGFIFAHVFDVVAYKPDEVMRDPVLLLKLWDGISSFGGFSGAVFGALAWSRQKEIPTLPFADMICFGLPLGWLFGRTGCFVVHDHPGNVTDFFLGVEDYRVGMPPYQVRHDLGLYEVIWSAAVIALFFFLGRKKRPAGFYAALLPILYAPVRFVLDFLRMPDAEGGDARYFGFTPAQYVALAFIALGLAVWARMRQNPNPKIPPAHRWPPEAPPKLETEPRARSKRNA